MEHGDGLLALHNAPAQAACQICDVLYAGAGRPIRQDQGLCRVYLHSLFPAAARRLAARRRTRAAVDRGRRHGSRVRVCRTPRATLRVRVDAARGGAGAYRGRPSAQLPGGRLCERARRRRRPLRQSACIPHTQDSGPAALLPVQGSELAIRRRVRARPAAGSAGHCTRRPAKGKKGLA